MMKRRYERYAYALSLLDKEPDLKGNDQIEIDREKAPFPASEEDANKLWEQRVKNDVISLKLKDKKWPEIKEKLTKRYNLAIRRLTQTKADDIVQIYINACLLYTSQSKRSNANSPTNYDTRDQLH